MCFPFLNIFLKTETKFRLLFRVLFVLYHKTKIFAVPNLSQNRYFSQKNAVFLYLFAEWPHMHLGLAVKMTTNPTNIQPPGFLSKTVARH